MNLLMICPTRSRPDRIREMITSFYDTRGSKDTVLCVVTSNDDPRVHEYNILIPERIVIAPSRYAPAKLNYIATQLHPGYNYYGIVDDDQIFRTKNWDIIFIEEIEKHKGWGLACGQDLFNDNWYQFRHPNGCVVSGNFVKLFGYLVYPKFQHTGVDHWQADLFGESNCLFHCPDVIIEHMHVNAGKAKMDDNYHWVYSDEIFDYGMNVWHDWQAQEMSKDIEKLTKAMKGERNV